MNLKHTNPTISIIIPCYNVVDYISECLESIINQTYPTLEIICINDGSTDDTLVILAKLAAQDSRILLIDQQNKGISAARNTALSKATGDFVMFVDGDDWLNKDTISALFQDYTDEDLIVFSYTREFKSVSLSKNLSLHGVYSAEYIQRRLVGSIDQEKKSIDAIDALAPVWGKLYRKSILPQNLVFKDLTEIGTWEDGFFNTEILNGCKNVLVVNQPLYHYRKSNSTSFTSLHKPDLQQKWITKFKLLETFLKEQQKDNTYFVALNNRVSITFLGLCLNEINSGENFFFINRKIKQFLKDDFYENAFSSFSLKYLPLHWKVFYYFAQIKFSFGVTTTAFLIHLLINRKN